jgi:hypothetical protein
LILIVRLIRPSFDSQRQDHRPIERISFPLLAASRAMDGSKRMEKRGSVPYLSIVAPVFRAHGASATLAGMQEIGFVLWIEVVSYQCLVSTSALISGRRIDQTILKPLEYWRG